MFCLSLFKSNKKPEEMVSNTVSNEMPAIGLQSKSVSTTAAVPPLPPPGSREAQQSTFSRESQVSNLQEVPSAPISEIYSIRMPKSDRTSSLFEQRSPGFIKSFKTTLSDMDRDYVKKFRQYAQPADELDHSGNDWDEYNSNMKQPPQTASPNRDTFKTNLTFEPHNSFSVRFVAKEKDQQKKLLSLQNKLIPSIIKATRAKFDISSTPFNSSYSVEEQSEELLMAIPLDKFLHKLKKHVNEWCEDDNSKGDSIGAKCLIISYAYMKRLKRRLHGDGGLVVTEANIRNLFLVGYILATKFLDDWIIPTKYWATVVGVPVKKIEELEMRMCQDLNFRLFVNDKTINRVLRELSKVQSKLKH